MSAVQALEAALPWSPVDVPDDIPTGDMPGDRVSIGPRHVQVANALVPMLVPELLPALRDNPNERAVVAVAGGSGVGKSEVASVVSYLLRTVGVGTYTLSGDNYPRRIPSQNDAERLRVFRNCGLRGLVADGRYSPGRAATLRALQVAGTDADAAELGAHPWLAAYQRAGRDGLRGYLGSPREIDFDHLSDVVGLFKNGAAEIHLRRMGRGDADLWYEEVDLRRVDVLVIEWTHGNSEHLVGVDVPVLLNSTPAETLAHRRARGRDGATDSAFTTMVLEIEQELLAGRAARARVIVSRSGERLTHGRFRELMAEPDGPADD